MARGREIVFVPMPVVAGCLGLVALGVVGALGLGLALELVSRRTLSDPGEAVNRRALEAFVDAARAGRAPEVPGGEPRAVEALSRSTSYAVTDTSGAYADPSHGTTCFDLDVTGPAGTTRLIVRLDGDDGPPVVTDVVSALRCTCRRGGFLRCGAG